MKNKKPVYYLLIAFALCLAISIILAFTPLTFIESLRITFGSIFVLFLPGFVIVCMFFKKLDIIEKIALSFALSIAIVPLTIFYLNLLGVRINTLNSIITVLAIIAISIGIYRFKQDKEK